MDSMSIFIAAMLIMIDLMIEHFHSEQSFFIDDEEYLKHTNQVELKIKTAMLKEILKDLSSQYSEGN